MTPRNRREPWYDILPSCAPSECWDAVNFAEAVYLVQIELDLIDEGQEAAECYTRKQVGVLRKFVKDNLASLKSMSL